MIVDANVLISARNTDDPRHDVARSWLESALNGSTRVGLPWPSLTAFVRIATHPRVFATPLTPRTAGAQLLAWLDAPAAWVPLPTEHHGEVFAELIARHDLVGAASSDAHLAALAIEHGVAVASNDADFRRFREVSWIDPLS